jgi:Tfp pilus assembly protein PilO
MKLPALKLDMERLQVWRASAQRQIRVAGWPGLVGAGLLLVCGIFYWSQIEGQKQRVAKLEQELKTLRSQPRKNATSTRSTLTTDEQLAAFYAFFPSRHKTADILATLYAEAAKHALRIDRAEYRTTSDSSSKLTRYQIVLPVHGTYLQIRRFVTSLLTDVPVAAIENVQFQRQKAGDQVVEAKIRLVLYLGGA